MEQIKEENDFSQIYIKSDHKISVGQNTSKINIDINQ